MPSGVTSSRHHGSALVALWFGVILCSVTFNPVGAWIPFFGEETHKHLNLESHHREWDILDLLSINGSQTGVSAARGPIPDTPAWRLRAVYDNIQLDPSLVPKIASTLHDELTLYFVYKQHKKTLGSLISINMPGKIKPWFQVISNLKTQRLNVFYHIKEDSKTHQASFQMPDKVGWTWTRILVSVNQTQVRFWVNCADYDKQKLAGHIDLQIPEGSLIYFRQEPGLKNKLIGSIQMAKLMNYSVNDRVWKCSYDSQFGPGWRPPLLG
ncbi:kielin/chordin-like protein [Macrobrachium rosenbergii]|uniref:kielin/chordin-like protein n=1 Tax=Macrobrachium rosenbergii TaxID=79674 RepID=UPI0034D3F751